MANSVAGLKRSAAFFLENEIVVPMSYAIVPLSDDSRSLARTENGCNFLVCRLT